MRLWFALLCLCTSSFVAAMMPAHSQSLSMAVARIPSVETLSRVGLVELWSGVAPIAGAGRVLRMDLSKGKLFVQTSDGFLHALDAESGQLLWTTDIGRVIPEAYPVATNSRYVFLASLMDLYGFDLNRGTQSFRLPLSSQVSCGPAADEERVMVGTNSGQLSNYRITNQDFGWAWVVDRFVTAPPILTSPTRSEQRLLVFPASNGTVHVTTNVDNDVSIYRRPSYLFRFKTRGPVTAPLGTLGTRTILIGSQDNTLYAIDLFTAEIRWRLTTEGPILQRPVGVDDTVYLVNSIGMLYAIDGTTGIPNWKREIGEAQYAAATPNRIYLRNAYGDLALLDRNTGEVIAMPADSLNAGLNLRDYSITYPNQINDRIYIASLSGQILALCEPDPDDPQRLKPAPPRPIRDPNEEPFGYIPPQPDDGSDLDN